MKKSAAILVGLTALGVLFVLRPWSSDGQTPAAGDAPPLSEQVASTPEPDRRVTAGVPDMDAPPSIRQEVTPEDPIDVRAPKTPATITVRGSVLAAEGGPIAGATVAVTAGSGKAASGKLGSGDSKDTGIAPATTTTAADGSFEVLLRHDVDQSVSWIRARARAPERVTDTQLAVIEGPQATVAFLLDRAIVIAGQVIEPDGSPIAGARVWTWRETQSPTLTDHQGRFRLDDIDPDIEQHYVHARAAGYIERGEMTRIADGAPLAEVTLVLERGARVSGTVLAGAQPVEDAVLSISRGKSAVEATSDDQGAFLLDGAPSGPQTLSIRHPDFAPQARDLDVPPPGAEARITITLQPGRALRGVVRGPRGEPVADARISARVQKEVLRRASSGEDGTFELVGLPSGDLSIRCTAEGYVPATEPLPAGVGFVTLTLDAGARFAGTVLDAATGKPIPKFVVRFLPPGTDAGSWGRKGAALFGGWRPCADPDGHWDSGTEGWPEGFVIDVEVRAEGHATARSTGLVARIDADPEQHRVALDTGTTLRGSVVTPIGAPLARATVRALRGNRGVAGPTTTDARGTFEFTHVPSGTLRLTVEHTEWGVFTHPVQIPEGAGVWEELVEVHAQATLSGFVRASGGQAVPDARVRLGMVDVPGARSRTWADKCDAAGQFSFDHLPPGSYRLARIEDSAGSEGKSLELFAITVTIDGSDPQTVDLVATGTGSVRGMLSAAAPIPQLTYVRLEPLDADDTPDEEQQTPLWARARGGVFAFQNLEAGAYRLVVSFRDQASGISLRGTQDIEVTDGAETNTTVTLEPVTAPGGK